MHPFKPLVLHVDFQRVDGRTRIKKNVPLHYVNEENSPAVKTEGCVVNHVVTELNIECLASQLPEFITVDLGEMTKGQSLHVSDIKLERGVRVVLHGKPNPVIASANVPEAEEEEPAAEAAAAVVVPAAADKTKPKKSEKQNKK